MTDFQLCDGCNHNASLADSPVGLTWEVCEKCHKRMEAKLIADGVLRPRCPKLSNEMERTK